MACGMPGWYGLLEKLIEEAESAVTSVEQAATLKFANDSLVSGQFMLAVSLIRQVLNESEIDAEISRIFSRENLYRSTKRRQKIMIDRIVHLVNGPWRGICTTNYDDLIEFGLEKYTNGIYDQTNSSDHSFGTILCKPAFSRRFFVKIHGSVRGGGYVLGTEEYDRVYLTNPQVTAFLTATMLNYNLVFLGCSVEDEILRLRRRLCHDFGGRIPTAYAILPESGQNLARRQWLSDQAKIVSVLYVTENDPLHEGLNEFLRCARNQIDLVGQGDNDSLFGDLYLEYRKLNARDRLNKIGSANIDILKFIYLFNEEKEVPHNYFLEPDMSSYKFVSSKIILMSPSERIYRILFLIAIKLIEHRTSPMDEPLYCINSEVEAHLCAVIDDPEERTDPSP